MSFIRYQALRSTQSQLYQTNILRLSSLCMHVIAKLDARFLKSLILVTEPYVIH